MASLEVTDIRKGINVGFQHLHMWNSARDYIPVGTMCWAHLLKELHLKTRKSNTCIKYVQVNGKMVGA